ncbi:MAG: hypothetical protein ABH832_03515 [bacterium]
MSENRSNDFEPRPSVSARRNSASKAKQFSNPFKRKKVARKIKLKKENFFALMFSLTPNGGNAFHPTAPTAQNRRSKIPSPPTPFLFACLLETPSDFFGRRRGILKKRRSRPCPTPPVRGRQKGTPFMIF